jgi:hypothetical protein
MRRNHMPEQTYVSTRPALAASATVSGLTAIIAREVIEKRFPPGYFKTVNVTTASFSFKSEPNQIPNPPKPILSVTPRWESQEETMWMPTMQNRQAFQYLKKPLLGNYPSAMWDAEKRRGVFAVPDRMRVDFDVKIRVRGVMQAMDLVHYIKGIMEPGGYFYHRDAVLEAVIPNAFVSALMDDLRIHRDDPADLDKFRQYVLERSGRSMDRKRRLADGRDVWIWQYKCNILLSMTANPSADIQKKDKVEDDQDVGFTISAEIWTPCKWAMILEGDVPIPFDDRPMEAGVNDVYEAGGKTMISFALSNSAPPQVLPDGKIAVDAIGFVADEGSAATERLELEELMVPEMLRVAQLNVLAGVDNWSMFSISLYREGGVLLERPKDWDFDWKGVVLNMANPFSGVAHTLVLYADLVAANAVLEAVGPPENGPEFEPMKSVIERRRTPIVDANSAGMPPGERDSRG